MDKSIYEVAADCHGYTFTEDALWINDDDVPALIKGEGYKSTTEAKANVVIYKNGGKVIHSARKNANGTYTNNAGIMKTETVKTADEALRGMTSDSRTYYIDPGDLQMKYLGDGKKSATGYKEYTKEQISQAAMGAVIEYGVKKLEEGKKMLEDFFTPKPKK